MTNDRPKKKAIPNKLKLQIYIAHGGRCARTGEKLGHYLRDVEYNHTPPVAVRPVNAAGTDYIPPQLDPNYIEPLKPSVHKVETNGESVEKKHLLAKNHDKAKISRTRNLRESHQEFLEAQASKVCGQKRRRSGKWPSRGFGRRATPKG